MKNSFYFLIILFALSSCGAIHNTPKSQTPNKIESSSMAYSFVDQNGNFYPDNWSSQYGKPPKNAKSKEFSLKKLASEKGKEIELSASEKTKIAQVANSGKNKNRIFVFVHGFNASSEEVTKSYRAIKSQLNTTNKDQIINFYWDGLVAQSMFGAGKIWFNATNNSQMAGEFGLRRLLNSYQNKDIYIISHSRGASVVLSSLSNPPFSKREIEDRKDDHNVDIDNDSKILQEKNNSIYCIMLAPAIGTKDFKSEDLKSGEDSYREFSPQLKKVHITINNTDPTLKKFLGFLSDKLKPTDLGYKSDAFDALKEHYDFLEKTDFSGQKSHNFDVYIRNPKFKVILKEFNIAK
ncbi:alpha/beta hydrolase [Soonwooa sp.]|uniref:alpha/beta hydrolase n=1 Tax=Soonwooa sp. TaxID=1938592 RepID=UPI0028AD85F6|nr:alpha/beta hydrolase [Soonwooa sp.]